jgi:uncharacterized membrane protein YhaH (DUF805 family)
MDLLRFLFRVEGRLRRGPYLLAGLSLMAVKYAAEALLLRLRFGVVWTPWDSLVPSYSLRASKLEALSSAWLLLLALWSVPFLWAAAALTLRRVRDAGRDPLLALAIFLPLVGYLWMAILASLSSRPAGAEGRLGAGPGLPAPQGLGRLVLAVGLPAVGGLLLALVSAHWIGGYGSALFLGTPLLMGFSTAQIANHRRPIGLRPTLGLVCLSLAVTSALFLLFALEGLVCLVLAAGVSLPVALIGGLLGTAVARPAPQAAGLFPALALIPLVLLEQRLGEPPVFEVRSSIEIAAPPEAVWPNVIGFAELPPPQHWLFETGIAYPLRARIEGSGVGAVRHCEFSTGAFVEPITAWEPPRRLAFDVASAPAPMEEWSFYARVEPPHLSTAFRSLRGEFRLVPLPGDRTRLEGSTWYRLDMGPVSYWRLIADQIVQRIHRRVLDHIADLSTRRP